MFVIVAIGPLYSWLNDVAVKRLQFMNHPSQRSLLFRCAAVCLLVGWFVFCLFVFCLFVCLFVDACYCRVLFLQSVSIENLISVFMTFSVSL